jgi:hypothetical protein
MRSETHSAPASKATLRAGRILTAIAVLLVLFDGLGKVMKVAPVMEACVQLEVPEHVVPGLGVVLIVATLIHAIPQTAFLGAVVLTGYLGGATWTHVRMGGPIFPIVFPSLVAAMIWGGLLLREPRLRALFPVRRQTPSTPGHAPADHSSSPRDVHNLAETIA